MLAHKLACVSCKLQMQTPKATWQSVTSAPLYLSSQIKQLDAMTAQAQNLSSFELMQKAARCAFNYLMHQYPNAYELCFFAGQGNNGGDALVLASYAQRLNFKVQLYLVGDSHKSSANHIQAKQMAQAAGVSIKPISDYQQPTPDLIIDGLLGIGLQGDLRDDYAQAIALMNALEAPVFCLDVPSGLQADSGNGAQHAVQAHSTLTFIAHKIGLLTGQGKQQVGALYYADLGCSKAQQQQLDAKAYAYCYDDSKQILPKRQSHAHKGNFGHLFLAGGNHGMGGAIIIAGMLAARTGVGKLSCLTQGAHLSPLLTRCPEIMCQAVATQIPSSLWHASTALAIGPGLGQDKWAQALLNSALTSGKPCVLDADALNLLANKQVQLETNRVYILTPHAQEAARLLKVSVAQIEQNRLDAATKLAQTYQAVVVLKGAGSIIASNYPNDTPRLCLDGHPSMAKAGMGDALTGIIGGFLAQGLSAFEAAYKGVCVHAKACELVCQEHGEAGLLAQDLSTKIGRLISRDTTS